MEQDEYTTSNLDVGAFNDIINPNTFQKVEAYNLHKYHHVVIARNKKIRDEKVALRLRIGRVGYAQWLNELDVYLLPDFRHKNIVPFLGCDKRYASNRSDLFTSNNLLEEWEKESDSYHSDDSDNLESEPKHDGPGPSTRWKPLLYRGHKKPPCELRTMKLPIEYWIVNDFNRCHTLRHYIMQQPLTWPQMILIARGIADGLHYLHEHYSYKEIDLDNDRGAEGFRRESDNKMKFFLYPANRGTVRIQPPNLMTIVHRSLSSMNIVLRGDLTPCIWNFGTAHVYHPYQPLNYLTIMDRPNQYLIMNSVYTPPEVLRTSSVFTPRAMRAVDMYALGFIFWEMLSRCRLPPIVGGMSFDNVVRENPGPYVKPLSRELKTEEPTCNLLYKNVCVKKIRPNLKPCWMRGKKSNRFVSTIKELWDEDHDARIQVATVIERLAVTSLRCDKDARVTIHMGRKGEAPLTEDQMDPAELRAMPTAGEPPHDALPRFLDDREPKEGVRYVRSDAGPLEPRQAPSRRQQRINVQRQMQLQRQVFQRHPPPPPPRSVARQRDPPPERRSVRLASRYQRAGEAAAAAAAAGQDSDSDEVVVVVDSSDSSDSSSS